METNKTQKLVSLIFVRNYFLHYFCQLLFLAAFIFLFDYAEIRHGHHAAFSSVFFSDDFLHSEIDGLSAPLALGLIILSFAAIIFFGLRGKLCVRENEKGEINVDVKSIFSKTEIFPVGKVAFTRKRGIRRVVTISAVFYDVNGNPKLVLKQHSNRLHFIPEHYEEGAPRIPLSVPRKFGSVHTIQQIWMEHGWIR